MEQRIGEGSEGKGRKNGKEWDGGNDKRRKEGKRKDR